MDATEATLHGGEQGEDDLVHDFPTVEQEQVDRSGGELDGQVIAEESDEPLGRIELGREIVPHLLVRSANLPADDAALEYWPRASTPADSKLT